MSQEFNQPLISVAPMMEWTDRHYRYMMRLITRETLLYTEMVTAVAILRGDREKLLAFSEVEKPLALQLGGDDPRVLAESAKIGTDFGYDEINLNVGCPSDRVQNGNFGACLMARPELVAKCVEVMARATDREVTVKHRVGINGRESYEELREFVRIVAAGGCRRFTVHARIAILEGLSPAENRKIPPLRYDDVYRLKTEFPELTIEINGGIREPAQIDEHLKHVDGVMIGRAAYENPCMFAPVDRLYFGKPGEDLTRRQVVEQMIPYVETYLRRGGKLTGITRHMINLFFSCPGARAWRRHLSENAYKPGAGVEVLEDALDKVPRETANEVLGGVGV